MKFFKFFEYVYLAFAVFFAYEAIRTWNENPDQAYLFAGIALLGIFMFFFRRRFRKKMEKRNQQ